MADLLSQEEIDALLEAVNDDDSPAMPDGVDKKEYRKLMNKRAKLLEKVAEVEAEMKMLEYRAFRESDLGKAIAKARESMSNNWKKYDMDKHITELAEKE